MRSPMSETPVKPVYLLDDNACEDLAGDGLERKKLAELIVGTAKGMPGPYTIGVFGRWGTGKTSVLRLAMDLASKQNEFKASEEASMGFVPVWFNAWQHEREANPVFSLIAGIVDALEHAARADKEPLENAKETVSKVKNALRALTRGFKFSGEVGVPLVGKVGVEFDAEKALAAEEHVGAQVNPLQGELLFTSAFALLRDVSEQMALHARIVVFIDDLDRCNPERAVHLLESIKLVLGQKGFVFVLGLDNQVIERYLDHVYAEQYHLGPPELSGSEAHGWGSLYMEKIVNLPLFLTIESRVRDDHYQQVTKRLVERYQSIEEFPSLDSLLNEGRFVFSAINRGSIRRFVRSMNRFLATMMLCGDPVNERRTVMRAFIADLFLVEVLGQSLRDRLAQSHECCQGILALLQSGAVNPVEITQNPLLAELRQFQPELESINSDVHTCLLHWLQDEQLRSAAHRMSNLTADSRTQVTGLSKNLAAAIRDRLSIPKDRVLTLSDVRRVTDLALYNIRYPHELRGIEFLSNLDLLNVLDSSLNDLGFLRLIPRLRELSITNCKLGSVDGLEALTNLDGLVFKRSQLESAASFPRLPQLRLLHFHDSTVFAPLSPESLPSLEELQLHNTGSAERVLLPGHEKLVWLSVDGDTTINKAILDTFPSLKSVNPPELGHRQLGHLVD